MKISVAMCTYNGGAYLQAQLDSIAAQTQLPAELVVCDDQSSDNTKDIVAAFAAKSSFPVHLWLNEKRLGSTKNFEKAIQLCTGDVIALADQDDVWYPKKLLRTADLLVAQPKVGLVFTDAEIVDESLQPTGRHLWQQIEFSPREQQQVKIGKSFDLLLRREANVVTGATMAFRSQFKELILPIPDDITEIHDGWIALMIAAVADVALLDELLMQYRQHPRQQIGVRKIKGTRSQISQLETGLRPTSHAVEINFLKTLQQRLLNCHEHPNKKSLLAVETKLAHLQGRANLPICRLKRLPFVIKELCTRRYHLYSLGTISAVKDLLL